MSIKNQVIKPVLLLFLFVGIGCSGEKLTESQVKSVIDEVQAGAEMEDADYILNYFADDAKIDLTMPPSMGGQRMILDKYGYKNMLTLGWKMATQLSYRVEDIAISMGPDSKSANVTSVVMETTEMMEEEISSKTHENVTIRLIDGKPLITNIVAKVEIDTP